ncbi:M99 family carboxypeptidase catalytic domain-containing protein [Arcobacter vandammei]|uniref:M99 family carboxypeptidase catalytic domain-containing protein n=1 Tax=Arcobacter vandammei TaxID=2782243 RepID=UPI0018DFC785|nr:M99 family carboxypeptidase catalytic domain-containing protein [Arcobacter vandammei]
MKFITIILALVLSLYGGSTNKKTTKNNTSTTNKSNVTNKEFTLYKKEANEDGNTLLIIGGIHGDEPGGYFAPSFFEKHYKITKGAVWVAPSVNIDSMVANQRGLYKDMNRKFSTLDKKDSDYANVQKIKKIITDKQVDLILNLHDGHGFYRKEYENAIFNPRAWGQATIIDQEKIHSLEKFGNLDEIASKVRDALNQDKLFQDFHYFGVKNTETKAKDEEQQLSLTYFAVTNNKPAFAIETSKNITDLTHKVIYQLKSIEEFMNVMEIGFERDFDVNNYDSVKKLVEDFGTLTINNNIKLNLTDIKKELRFVPMKAKQNNFDFDHNIANIKNVKNSFEIYIGNQKVTTLTPQIFEIYEVKDKIKIEVDGKTIETKLGEIIEVENNFKIDKSAYRVNIIGYSKEGVDSEDNILLERKDIQDAYSIDKNNQEYRAEFYKDNKFCGMIIIKFKK